MKLLETTLAILSDWTSSVAAAVIAGFDRVVSPRVVRLIEDDSGAFAVEMAVRPENVPARIVFTEGALLAPDLAPLLKGSRVEIVLQPIRFLFRPLELPSRAADFLEGVVRAQIDRLTPWSASEAVFGCSPPVKSGTDSITTVIAATPRKVAMDYVQAVSGFHPAAIAVCTDVAEPHAGRVKVFEQKARGHLDAARLSRSFLIALGVAAVAALLALVSAAYVADSLEAQESELARQISARRAIIRAGNDGDRSPVAALERRKYQTPASVIVLEALSQVLPDNTYITELHLAGNKLQISGVTRDAPSLIPLIEQSQHFTRATFYAPTTRSPSDPGERFHIEARIEAKNTASP